MSKCDVPGAHTVRDVTRAEKKAKKKFQKKRYEKMKVFEMQKCENLFRKKVLE